MEKAQVVRMVEILSQEARIPMPNVEFRSDSGGSAYYGSWRIRIGMGDRKASHLQIWDVVLHEMAHLVSWKKRGKRGHGREFFQELSVLARFWYGDVTTYDWVAEGRGYPSLLTRAVKAGYVEKPKPVNSNSRPGELILAEHPEYARFSPRYRESVVLA